MTTSDMVLGGLLVAAVAWMWLKRGGDKEAKTALQAGARLVDVRTPGEFGGGHLTGAINIPVSELPQRLREVGAKDQPIVVYCASGARSARAKSLLQAAGYTHVHNLGAMSNGQ